MLDFAPSPTHLYENSNGLVTRWKMLQIDAANFVRLLDSLAELARMCETGLIVSVGAVIESLDISCNMLELVSAEKQIERIRLELSHNKNVQSVAAAPLLAELHRRIREDLEESVFFQLETHHVRACFNRGRDEDREITLEEKTAAEFFGPEVLARFPSATFDIDELRRCWFLDRDTAAVFHAMRVLEIGLQSFARLFGIQSDHANWHKIIVSIESAIRDMPNDPTRKKDWQDAQAFYSKAASHFRFLKDAWRNYCVHAHEKYTGQEARSIVDNVRDFMRELRIGE